MFCVNCGKQIAPGTNFCPACGTRVGSAQTYAAGNPEQAQSAADRSADIPGNTPGSSWAGVPPPPPRQPLVRPRSPRILGGVCAGFALYFGWNLDVVRIVTAILGLFYGIGILAYLACWVILPEAQYALPQQSR